MKGNRHDRLLYPVSLRGVVLLGLLAGGMAVTSATRIIGADKPQTPALTFEKDVLPILRANCLRCHGDKVQKAGLDLRDRAAVLEGGDSGPAFVPGSAAKSLLWTNVAADKMPPGKVKLTAEAKRVLRRWIETGARGSGTTTVKPPPTREEVTAADRKFWAFQLPRRPRVPTVKATEKVRNPLDAFVLAALEKKGLTLSPEAGRLTLLRRVYFDLTGLPPSAADSDAFLADRAPGAYERLVDRLLASPRYGERWARHWLDLAGYADSEGILDADYVRGAAWRYRDYVIRAFNSDKPYDRFLKEQLAGDELSGYWREYETGQRLSPRVVEALTATGYLRCASDTSRPDFVTIKNAPGYYYQTLDDTLKIVTSSTLGLTVHCARCHSHKYDPIPQTDYYRLQAIFMSGYRPAQWVPQVQRRLLAATRAQEQEAKAHNAKVATAIAGLQGQLARLRLRFGERLFEERLAKLPAAIRGDVRTALATPPAKRNEVQKYLAGKFQAELRPAPAVLAELLPGSYPEYRKQSQALTAAIRKQEAGKRTFAEIRAFYDLPGLAKSRLLRRGDYLHPGKVVTPGVLSVLATPRPFAWKPPAKGSRTSGLRLAFADWLTQPGHPLTARVLVNRLWVHHFDEGLVATPDNFGRAGSAPSHPALLDWLATELVRRNWSVKAMHRLMVTSSTYRQASGYSAALHATARRVDPDNRLLWRQRLRRLSAEELRDAVLSVAGTLNRQMFGQPVPMWRAGDGEVTAPTGAAGRRRSVYLQVRRSQPLTFLQVFDQPVMETNCTRRSRSTVASQALTLLNSDFMVRQAEEFAGRVKREAPNDPVGYALRLAFQRPATARERKTLAGFLTAQSERYLKQGKRSGERAYQKALADLCHILLSANEFAYAD
jgi:hypothetical protein